MPLEIRELIIRATVSQTIKQESVEIDIDQIKSEVFEDLEYRIERLLKKRQER